MHLQKTCCHCIYIYLLYHKTITTTVYRNVINIAAAAALFRLLLLFNSLVVVAVVVAAALLALASLSLFLYRTRTLSFILSAATNCHGVEEEALKHISL